MGRKHACVQGAQPYMVVFESWTDHVHGLCTAVYTGRKTAVYMVHGHIRAVYTAVFGSWTDHVHGPCMVVYGLSTALVMYPVGLHGRPLYTGVFTARIHSRVRTVNTAVFRACLHGRVPCSRACLRKVYMAVGRVHGDIHGPCMAVYKVRSRPWTAVKTTVCMKTFLFAVY